EFRRAEDDLQRQADVVAEDSKLLDVLLDLGERLAPHLLKASLLGNIIGDHRDPRYVPFRVGDRKEGVVEDHPLPLIDKPSRPTRREDLPDELLPSCGDVRREIVEYRSA